MRVHTRRRDGTVRTSREILDQTAEEKALLKSIIEEAEWQGWRAYHATDSRLNTIYGETGEGFPDLVLIRPPDLLIVETKAESGQPEPAQLIWLGAFMQVTRIHVQVWRPRDQAEISRVLARRPEA